MHYMSFYSPLSTRTIFNIVKYPMDLGTIDRKLVNGEYKNPWEVGDVCTYTWLEIGDLCVPTRGGR